MPMIADNGSSDRSRARWWHAFLLLTAFVLIVLFIVAVYGRNAL